MDKSPDAFRTISEVADDLDLPQHVLRFWETRFPQIKPMKRGGGRRYYRPEDVDLLKGIRHLLYDHGYTIKGVQKLLKSNGNKFVAAIASGDVATMEAIMAANNERQTERHVEPKAVAATRIRLSGAPRSSRAAVSSALADPATMTCRMSRSANPVSARRIGRSCRRPCSIFWNASACLIRCADRHHGIFALLQL